jgi:hypothetical protein
MLASVSIPVTEIGELLLGARWAQVTRLSFVETVSWAVSIEGMWVGQAPFAAKVLLISPTVSILSGGWFIL